MLMIICTEVGAFITKRTINAPIDCTKIDFFIFKAISENTTFKEIGQILYLLVHKQTNVLPNIHVVNTYFFFAMIDNDC